jgi:prepilin-type N-terminal cleavage/methylation domain-containing protein
MNGTQRNAAYRCPSMGAQAGVTLLELLVAVSLFALLAVGMAFALRISLSGSSKAQGRIMDNRRVLGVERVLRNEVADLIPALTVCGADSKRSMTPTLLFEGAADRVRFASAYSLSEAGRGQPRLLEFQVIPGENSQGVRLVVNERLYTGIGSRASVCTGFASVPGASGVIPVFAPIETGPFSFVLADKLAFCRMSYEEPRPAPELSRWVPQWLHTNAWPMAVRFEMKPLAPSSSALELSTITVPLHITRDPYEDYRE